jgi:hypothetical protein
MKIDFAHAYVPCEAAPASSITDLIVSPASPRSWRPAEEPLEALPGWWVTAGYWDRDAVEDWFTARN